MLWYTTYFGFIAKSNKLHSLVELTTFRICQVWPIWKCYIVLHRFSYMVILWEDNTYLKVCWVGLPNRNAISWSTSICEYVEKGYVEELQYMLYHIQMERPGVSPNLSIIFHFGISSVLNNFGRTWCKGRICRPILVVWAISKWRSRLNHEILECLKHDGLEVYLLIG